ncbi:hypothetical protein E9229_001620 [Paeniglutamicibacter cryotolerans]|uniref:Uncharacterized protein n=1 Tax=Paeniglutamicibacter cryotolerans TaxID=670079 RepID=A0A839QGX6_9MICC|nr:hypothetical protein [Paeniglutamicibacter cryotolerans]
MADTHYPNLIAAAERNSPAADVESDGGRTSG